jgi:hypothetical protein
MSTNDCAALVGAYADWLRSGLSAAPVEGGCELTTPFLDRHNDHLQIYAERIGDKIVLTDDGYILSDLKASGLDINTDKRRDVLAGTLRGFGVHLRNGELTIEAAPSNVGARIHSMVQAMLAVNDMYVMGQERVAGFFFEDVRTFLEEHQVRYVPRIKVAGTSGYDHTIDFLIPRSPERPERLVQAIAAPSRDYIIPFLFAITDTRQTRGADAEAYAFLNDEGISKIAPNVTEALEEYDVTPAYWSQREHVIEALTN